MVAVLYAKKKTIVYKMFTMGATKILISRMKNMFVEAGILLLLIAGIILFAIIFTTIHAIRNKGELIISKKEFNLSRSHIYAHLLLAPVCMVI